MNPARTEIFGCPVDRLSCEEILAAAHTALTGGAPLSIEGLNVAKMIAARRDPSLMKSLRDAGLVHVDGAGIALAAKLLGYEFPPRRAGIDVMGDLLELCAAQQKSVYLLGATEEIVVRAAESLRIAYPGLIVAGTRNGYFREAEEPAIAAAIAASGASLLLIGISSPKKEVFLNRHMQACGVAVAMGVGGSFDVVAGAITRAPQWMQRIGFEWLFRLIQEPRRLARRYIETNSLFALLLLREMLRRYGVGFLKQLPLSWADFLRTLHVQAGHATMHCRHEIYFLRQKPSFPRLRAVAALLRDVYLLATQPRSEADASAADTLAVVTLPGASGYGTMTRAIAALPQASRCVTIAHPRCQQAIAGARLPTGVTLRDIIHAAARGATYLLRRHGTISRVIIASCVARHTLWQASWAQLPLHYPALRRVLLHNDFDMMSSACVAALSPKLEAICVQHGIPTDEFFPTHAPTQIVWGETSRVAYAVQHQGALIVDGFGRDHAIATMPAHTMPQAMVLVSQTHTPVYGINLKPHFESLAQALTPHAEALGLRILLHPAEAGNAAIYPRIDKSIIAAPPHASLQTGAALCVVVGYCSTALIEAAMLGHYVVAMGWQARASLAAHAVCKPPVVASDATNLLAIWQGLRDDAAQRARHREMQIAWLGATFAACGAFQHHCQ